MLSLILFSIIGFRADLSKPAKVLTQAHSSAPNLSPNRVTLTKGRSAGTFALNLPKEFGISVAAEGLKRVRFMARSPDGRIFVTDMFNLTDNKQGAVYILDQFDPAARSFKKVTAYLNNLRNPNSIAFYTDPAGGEWLYLALTHQLVRYRFTKGETAPTAKPEVLATFPDYGLTYKYGGWHLTRTIAVGGNGKIYISVGSSCNACEEKEDVRASVIEMDPDGKNQRHFARGLRNAVGLRWISGLLVATNMGSDHLGDNKPADTMYFLKDGTNYGWPYCYQSGSGRFPDPKFNLRSKKMDCREVPRAFATFEAHSSPLGFEYFDAYSARELRDSFLVALHGSTKESLNRGYRVVRQRGIPSRTSVPENFIDGFLEGKKIHGRPCDILSLGNDSFLFTDDYAGVVYFVYKK